MEVVETEPAITLKLSLAILKCIQLLRWLTTAQSCGAMGFRVLALCPFELVPSLSLGSIYDILLRENISGHLI